MTQQEIEIIKTSSEFRAANTLADAHNLMGFNHEKFAMGVCMQHRTLQQNIMRSFVATIRQMASENYGYDLRNQSSHDAAKKMVESGLLDEIYLPFV